MRRMHKNFLSLDTVRAFLNRFRFIKNAWDNKGQYTVGIMSVKNQYLTVQQWSLFSRVNALHVWR